MRVVSLNLNGIRAAWKKGAAPWLLSQQADIICLQETRAQTNDMSPEMLSPGNMHSYYHNAERRGYSGVAIWSTLIPRHTRHGCGLAEFDAEGRYLQADFDTPEGELSVVSLYFPSGSSSPARQEAKWRFLDGIVPVLEELRCSNKQVLLCGDLNIAHQNIDLTNWRSNQKNSGFLPEEREWLTSLFDRGWVDVYRRLYPQTGSECYTWWSNRGAAWAKNVGWRIDYQIATPDFAACACKASVYKEERFSDHAPLLVDYARISSRM